MRTSLTEHRIIYEFQTNHSKMMQQDNQINTHKHMRKHLQKRLRYGKVRLDLPKGPQSTTRRSRRYQLLQELCISNLLHLAHVHRISTSFWQTVFFISLIIFTLFCSITSFFFLLHRASLRLFISFLGTRLRMVYMRTTLVVISMHSVFVLAISKYYYSDSFGRDAE